MKKELKGFTVIEVALVLALAGVIFLMVFIALPQMIRQQRDAERKDDVMMFVGAVKKFQTNNRGVLPNNNSPHEEMTWNGFIKAYIDDKYDPTNPQSEQTFGDPSEGNYTVKVEDCGVSEQGKKCSYEAFGFDATMHVITQAVCGQEEALATVNPRDFAVLYKTDSSGIYCFDSQTNS